MTDLVAPLAARIKNFLKVTGMKPSRFGRNAAGNSMFLKRMEEGKVTLSTLREVTAYLDEQEAPPLKKKGRS